MAQQNQEVLSAEERARRVYNLSLELRTTEQQKKDTAGGFRDEIKRIKAEIKDLLTETPIEAEE